MARESLFAGPDLTSACAPTDLFTFCDVEPGNITIDQARGSTPNAPSTASRVSVVCPISSAAIPVGT